MMFIIEQLKKKGRMLKEPFKKHIEDGIFELRTQQGSDYLRILYFFAVGSDVILTNGFSKDVDKTPENAKLLAKRLRDEYFNKGGN